MTIPDEPLSNEESKEAEQLSEALEALQKGDKLNPALRSEELQMAAQLHASRKDPQLSQDVDKMTEALLLSRFAKKVDQKESLERGKAMRYVSWYWSLTGGLAGLIVVLVVASQMDWSRGSQTLAEAQDFDSLSEAEEVLGALLEDAKLPNGTPVAELRLAIHQINLIIGNTDFSLNPEADLFPHVELRSAALDVLDLEETLFTELEESVDLVAFEENHLAFAEKVSGWPTTNEGVDYETHANAVNTFQLHIDLWEEFSLELAEEIVDELE